MLVGIATDHGGFPLKKDLVAHIRIVGYPKFGFELDRIVVVAKELLRRV